MQETTTLFRARVPAGRLKKAEKILSRLGLKPGEAFNMMLAQIEIQKGLPFEVKDPASGVLTADDQAQIWLEKMGAY